jgi:predicted small metal-binding protein
MTMVITCECGYVIRGSDDEELVRAARAHISTNHPAVDAQVRDADFLAMAERIGDDDTDPSCSPRQ